MSADTGQQPAEEADGDGVAAAFGLSVLLMAVGGVADVGPLVVLGLLVFLAVGGALVVGSVFEDPDADPAAGALPADRGLGALVLGAGGLVVAGAAGGAPLLTTLGSLLAMAVLGAVAVTWVLSEDAVETAE